MMTTKTTLIPFENGSYQTPARKVSWFARTFPGIVFYLKAFLIVMRSSRMAKRGLYDGAAWAESSYEVMRALESVGVEFEITGTEHLENLDEPYLVIGNHMSTLETMVLPCIVQPFHHVTFVVKQVLLEYPIFKHVMRSRDPIAVTQTDPRGDYKTMLTEGVKRLKDGISIIVFPEGERTLKYETENFNSIGVKLASKANVPIVPVAIDSRAWGLGKIIGDVGWIDASKKVRFAFGEPLHIEGRGAEQQQMLTDFIEAKLRDWGTLT